VVSLSSMPTGGFSSGFCSAVAAAARIGGVPVTFAGACRTWEVVMDRWTVTVEEAAQMLGISRSSAYECVRRGELRALRLGRRLVVPRVALEELLGARPAVLPTSTSSEPPC
jgi:excisionase family DNA binding protein